MGVGGRYAFSTLDRLTSLASFAFAFDTFHWTWILLTWQGRLV